MKKLILTLIFLTATPLFASELQEPAHQENADWGEKRKQEKPYDADNTQWEQSKERTDLSS